MGIDKVSEKKQRPALVWVISIFYFISFVWTAFSYWLVYSGLIPMQPEQAAYFSHLRPLDHGITFLLMAINLSAAIALFLLRKQAFYLYFVSLIAGILITLWHILTKNWLQTVGVPGAIGSMIGYGISIAICVYAWKLIKEKVLI